MGAAPGNKNPQKNNTPEKRAKAYKAYCDHMAQGLSGKAFHSHGIEKTILKMINDYPKEFDPDELACAKAQGIAFYERAGIAGMMGKIKGFNGHVWQCQMSNRAGWNSAAVKHSGDAENPVVVITKFADHSKQPSGKKK
jgi:hypothetical protein